MRLPVCKKFFWKLNTPFKKKNGPSLRHTSFRLPQDMTKLRVFLSLKHHGDLSVIVSGTGCLINSSTNTSNTYKHTKTNIDMINS